MLPTHHLASRWHPWWVRGVLFCGALCTTAALYVAHSADFTATQLLMCGAIGALTYLATREAIELPQKDVVRPSEIGIIPAVVVLGWPLAPLIICVARLGVTLADVHAATNKDGKRLCLLYHIVSLCNTIIATILACLADLTLRQNPAWLYVTLFLVENGLAYHEKALAGWSNPNRHGGVGARWRQLITSWRASVLPHQPFILATGLLVAYALLRLDWPMLVLTLLVARATPLLLWQHSSLLAQQAKSALAAVQVMEARDEYTKGHTIRVTAVTIRILQHLKCPFLVHVEAALAGPIHDIGKICTPDMVLQKPERHTKDERRIMEQHVWDDLTPDKTWHPILARWPQLRWLVELIVPGTWVSFVRRCHHLELNGNGYPESLQRYLMGERIPLVARTMAVADVWDAMTSTRPYRAGMPAGKALTLLQDSTDQRQTYGGQLDTRCVDALAELVNAQIVVPNNSDRCVIDEIYNRFIGKAQPLQTYLLSLLAGSGLVWLTSEQGGSTFLLSALLIAPLIWVLWANAYVSQSSHNLLRRLVLEAERRMGYTEPEAFHARLLHLTALLAAACRLPRNDRKLLRQAADLINLGTLAVSDNVWKKAGNLSAEDWCLIRDTPVRGASLTVDNSQVSGLIRHHMERWDGGGHPNGLAGTRIPLLARILRVAKGLAALEHPRPHRSAHTTREALVIMRNDGAYDPYLLEILDNLVN